MMKFSLHILSYNANNKTEANYERTKERINQVIR